jgi:hypothetical protein
MKDITTPQAALERWDELLTRRKVFGFYACNAHGGFPITQESSVNVPIPSYAAAFSLVGLAVDKKYEDAPDGAVRNGDFFSVLRGAGEPTAFEFSAEIDGRRFPSGSTISGSPEIIVRAETKGMSPRLVLKKDGQVLSTSKEKELRFSAQSPGVYRAEIYLDDHRFLSPHVPWILSNPIFVDPSSEKFVPEELPCDVKRLISLDGLAVEKDEDSSAVYSPVDEGATLAYHLEEATPEKINRWVALALRNPLDLSPYAGFYMVAESKDYMRYQTEIRSGEKSFYASAKLYPETENRVYIPFVEFYATFGGRETIPLDSIDSFFITVNTSSSRTGFSSSLTIKEMGFCSR